MVSWLVSTPFLDKLEYFYTDQWSNTNGLTIIQDQITKGLFMETHNLLGTQSLCYMCIHVHVHEATPSKKGIWTDKANQTCTTTRKEWDAQIQF